MAGLDVLTDTRKAPKPQKLLGPHLALTLFFEDWTTVHEVVKNIHHHCTHCL